MHTGSPSKTVPILSKMAEIMGHVGEELAFVAPDEDAGLLPLNKFVIDLEELVDGGLPNSVYAGVKLARGWLDQILDGSGKFTEASIRNFNVWHAWMTSALLSLENGTTIPTWPQAWTENSDPAPETPSNEAISLKLPEEAIFLSEFHSESLELLQSVEQGVLVLEENPSDIRHDQFNLSSLSHFQRRRWVPPIGSSA